MAIDPWGIESHFHDAFGVERATDDDTRAAILEAMGLDPGRPVLAQEPEVRIVRAGTAATLGAGGRLTLEDGTVLRVPADGLLPPDLPTGYHVLEQEGEAPGPGPTANMGLAELYGLQGLQPLQVIVTPGSCYLPDDFRVWGWAVQLYAVRSRASWGMGDLADLAALCAWTRASGGGAVLVNPLSAASPTTPVEPSPYYPSSRRFRSPLYLRIEDLPGAADAGDEIARLGTEARALNSERHIDRDRVGALKMRALEILWRRFGGDPTFDSYRRQQEPALSEFAAFCTLAERLGKDWRRWPPAFRRPGDEAVRRLIADDERVAFHCWVQWLLDGQLKRASAEVRVIHDLSVGFDVAGADGWCWQDLIANDISIGCPPDQFNLDGQDWGLAPFVPAKLRAARYAPFIETIRGMLRHAGGLRIDHVMGLFRLFWIPRRLGAAKGSFVRYPAEELLAIIDIESHRAGAVVIGEDLGTALPGTRETLAAHRLLSYRLLFFEPGTPDRYPELAASGVTTHDLATIAGIWTGAATDHMRGAGITPNTAGLMALKQKLMTVAAVTPDTPLSEVVLDVHRALARAPSRLLLATLDDALQVLEQPNMPGTTRSWPNWSLALPRSLEEIQEMDLPRHIGEVLHRR